jgi:hypothetical protein
MHPEMIRAIAAQQTRDWQADTQARGRVRLARQARKARRRSSAPDLLAGVRIPDYVDGTFHREGHPAGQPSSPRGAGSAGPATAATADGRGVPAGRDAA